MHYIGAYIFENRIQRKKLGRNLSKTLSAFHSDLDCVRTLWKHLAKLGVELQPVLRHSNGRFARMLLVLIRFKQGRSI